MDAGRDFEREIVVKVNVPEVLRRGAGAAVVAGRARRDGHEHRPVPVGRGALQAHAAGSGRRCATRANPCSVLTKSPLLLRDLPLLQEMAERAAGEREPLGPDARREGVAGQRAAHAASAGAAGGGRGAQPRGHPDRGPRRAAHARDQRRPRAGRADPRARRRGGRDERRRHRAAPARRGARDLLRAGCAPTGPTSSSATRSSIAAVPMHRPRSAGAWRRCCAAARTRRPAVWRPRDVRDATARGRLRRPAAAGRRAAAVRPRAGGRRAEPDGRAGRDGADDAVLTVSGVTRHGLVQWERVMKREPESPPDVPDAQPLVARGRPRPAAEPAGGQARAAPARRAPAADGRRCCCVYAYRARPVRLELGHARAHRHGRRARRPRLAVRARHRPRRSGPMLFRRLDPGTAGTVGFLIRLDDDPRGVHRRRGGSPASTRARSPSAARSPRSSSASRPSRRSAT